MSIYLYAFNEYAGFDRIFLRQNAPNKFNTGDILTNGTNEYLVLGDHIEFQEIYTYLYTPKFEMTLVYKGLLSSQTIELIHRMVYEWYTSYKNVIKLFLDQEIDKLLTKEIKSKKKKSYSCKIGENTISGTGESQTLIVFPDIWSFTNLIDQEKFEGIFLYSLDTQSKKNMNRWKIKKGEGLICTTSSEIFQDYSNLKKIYFVEPQKWYYASQQDPRYKIDMVIKKLAELHNAEIKEISSEMLY